MNIQRCTRLFMIAFCLLFLSVSQAKEVFMIPGKSDKVSELLEDGKSFADVKQWEKALECYQTILENYSDKLVEVEDGRFVTAVLAVMERLAQIPPEGFKMYQLFATKKFHLQQNSGQKTTFFSAQLERLIPFLATQEGASSLIQIIDKQISAEDYEECIPYIAWYLNYAYPFNEQSMNKGVWARQALCYYVLGDRASLESVQKFQSWQPDKKSIRIGTQNIAVDEYASNLLKDVDGRISVLDLESSWPMYGKNSSRRFTGSQTITNLEKSWGTELPIPYREEGRTFFYNESPRYVKGPCPYYPAIGNGTIFLNNGKDVFAYDILSSKQIWHFTGLIPSLESELHEQVIHTATYYKNAVFANVDGPTPTQTRDTWSYYQIRKILAERKLIKLDAMTGRLIWQLKDSEGDEESFANKVSFMSAPVAFGNSLYVGATELSGVFNSYVVAINPENGKIIWKTLIGSGQQELNMFGRPVREVVSSAITTGNGQLYYSTNLGACCSLDSITGRILWVYLYERAPLDQPTHALFRTVYRKPCWYNSPVILDGKSVYFAPLDSDYIYCLDAQTGKKRWAKYRESHQYLFTVTGNNVVIGGRSLEFLSTATGTSLGVIHLPDEISGMGVVSGQELYIPCTQHLYALDVDKKMIIQKFKWPEPEIGGHVIMANSAIVTTSHKYLYTFYDWDKIRKSLDAQISQTPQDPLPYIKLADLLSKRERHIEAQAFYEKGLAMAQNSQSVHKDTYIGQAERGLLMIYLSIAQKQAATGKLEEAHVYYSKALPFAKDSDTAITILLKQHTYYQRLRDFKNSKRCLEKLIAEYGQETYHIKEKNEKVLVNMYGLILLAQYYEQNSQPTECVSTYQKLLSLYPKNLYEGTLIQQWATQNIERLIAQFGREIYRQYDLEAREIIKTTRQKQFNSADLMRIIEQYPNSQSIPDITILMVQTMIQEGQIRNASEHLRLFMKQPLPEEKKLICYTLLVDCYEQMKMYGSAKTILKRMRHEFPESVVEMSREKSKVSDLVQKKLQEETYARIQEKKDIILNLWEENSCKLEFRDSSYASMRFLPVQGKPSEEHVNKVFCNTGKILSCYDGKTGERVWSQDVAWLYGIGFVKEILIGWQVNQIYRLDPDKGGILWQITIPNRFVSITFGSEQFAVITYDFRQSHSLISVYRPDSGKLEWTKELPGRNPGDLMIGQDVLVAYAKNPSAVCIYDIAQGNLLKHIVPENPKVPTWFYTPLLLSENYACLITENKKMECYELPSLKVLWQYDASTITGSENGEQPLADGNENYVCVARNDKQMVCISLSTGEIKWKRQVPENIYKIVAESDTVYFLENKIPEIYLWALDAQDGKLRWIGLVSPSQTSVKMFATQQYMVLLLNKYTRGYQSKVIVMDKWTGQKVKEHLVKRGESGRTYAEICISGENLWIFKDNMVWIMGK